MRSLFLFPFALLVSVAAQKLEEINVNKVYHYQPEQVHLAFGESTRDYVVTWSTRDDTKTSICQYGLEKFEFVQNSTQPPQKFIDGGQTHSTQYMHRVTLTNLQPEQRYIYHCGSPLGWSPQYWFRTPPGHAHWSPTLAIYGDLGNENAQSLPRLQQDTQRDMYDAILHVGDFAYDMHSENAAVGDEFMRQIEAIAAYVPYMVCAGNHEQTYNFSNYRARFSMPGGTENLFYSFDLGPIHFVTFSTELYYFLHYGLKSLIFQYEWLMRDLKEANQPENRKQRPWIITFAHRPMYCSNDNGNDCSKHETVVRAGLPLMHMFGLEKVFYEHGVDVAIWAHEHCYERMWPLYDYQVLNGSLQAPYHNPRAPVHIITGSAGNKEGREPFFKVMPKWSAFHSQDFGYTRLKAHNGTHLYFEQVSDDKDGQIIDAFWVVKDKHGSYMEV
ncbi:acid phosphatase type 7 isoform X2 [Rhagoletis pomonella]|uniref:acid phosphatase type 7 isoform X2 n=1 Tax=Rhagoletis pomonella TaxID=28610 RepID=UPI0017855991|nr:acid phosphatase type 7 isoform X2 [Rhagoletis pomonella]